jgi:hypothetical protein
LVKDDVNVVVVATPIKSRQFFIEQGFIFNDYVCVYQLSEKLLITICGSSNQTQQKVYSESETDCCVIRCR